VPIALVSGDEAACREARELLGPIETVAVKEGRGRYCGECLPLDEARRRIREGATLALDRVNELRPFVFDPPVRCEVTFSDPSFADAACLLPRLDRVDGRTIRFVEDDFLEAYRTFNAVHFLADAQAR